jgi:hypothetical protein
MNFWRRLLDRDNFTKDHEGTISSYAVIERRPDRQYARMLLGAHRHSKKAMIWSSTVKPKVNAVIAKSPGSHCQRFILLLPYGYCGQHNCCR